MNLESPLPHLEDRPPLGGGWRFRALVPYTGAAPLFHATSAARPTARPDLSERACFLTVPFQATVKSLSVERPVDGGAAEVCGRHDLARGLTLLSERLHPLWIDLQRTAGVPASLTVTVRKSGLAGFPFQQGRFVSMLRSRL